MASACAVHTHVLLVDVLVEPQETEMLEVNKRIPCLQSGMGSNLWQRATFGEGTQ